MRRDALTRPCPTQDPLFPHGVNGNRDAVAVISDSLPLYWPLGGPCHCGVLEVSSWYRDQPPGSASQHITQHGVFHGHRPVSDQPLPTGQHPKAPEKTSACWLHPGLISSSLAELLVGHVTFLWPRFQFWCCTNSGLTGRYIHVLNTQGMGEAKK